MSSSEKEKRCLYEVLGLSRDCSTDEIRSTYRKLALQRHPDKLIKSGLSEAEATAQFQELVNAYEVLSDPRERPWYDSHRSQILFSSSTTGNSSNSVWVPDIFSYFSNSIYSGYSDSGNGFYKVYGEVFDKIYQNELTFAKKMGVGLPKEAPLIGNLGSPYAQVTAFYNYWVGFVTVMDFCWVDQYEVMSGSNRKSRRMMEEENKKLRKKARRECSETVRGLAEFAKKRDKRVMDMQLKRSEEMERKKEEERKRKQELARLKAEKVWNYEEPEWTKIDEVEDEKIEESMEENGNIGNRDELYCVACGKKFKSEKQWKNHEQSKRHKEKVAELSEAFDNEDREYKKEDTDGREEAEKEHVDGGAAADNVFPTDDVADELSKQIDKQMGIGEDNSEAQSADRDGFFSSDADNVPQEQCLEVGAEDDEARILESTVSGQKKGNNGVSKQKPDLAAKKVQVDVDNDDVYYMEYNNVKGSRRNNGGRRRRDRAPEEARQKGFEDKHGQAEENIGPDDNSEVYEPSSYALPEKFISRREDDKSEKVCKLPKEDVEKKTTAKQDSWFKSKESAKGKKKKASTKVQSNVCEKCGEEFESRHGLSMRIFHRYVYFCPSKSLLFSCKYGSPFNHCSVPCRNKLHKHLGDTGHASLKFK